MRISDIFTDEIIDADIRKMMGKNAPKLPIKEETSLPSEQEDVTRSKLGMRTKAELRASRAGVKEQ